MSKQKQRIPLTLRNASMISYSQLYADEKESVNSLVKGIPSDEAVAWYSYIIFRKENLKIGENDLNMSLIKNIKDFLTYSKNPTNFENPKKFSRNFKGKMEIVFFTSLSIPKN